MVRMLVLPGTMPLRLGLSVTGAGDATNEPVDIKQTDRGGVRAKEMQTIREHKKIHDANFYKNIIENAVHGKYHT